MTDETPTKGGTPPVEHRFKPGESGNPNGRPKGRYRLETMVQKELDKIIEVEGEEISQQEAAARALVKKLIAGDQRIVAEMLKRIWPEERGLTLRGDPEAPLQAEVSHRVPMTPEQEALMGEFVEEFVRAGDEE